jgi:hypothetical protein
MRLRLPYVSVALIAAIAACGKPDPVANGANAVAAVPAASNKAAPAPTGGPPPAAAPAATSASPTATTRIPAALQGRWGLTPRDCTSALGDAKGLLVINGRELRFYESRAVPSPGVAADSDSISGNFAFTGEGQSWTKFETFELRNDALVRTESNPAASYTYAKC